MAADTFQLKRGTTAAVNAYLPALGEPVYDITLKRFSIGDGVTMGGVAPSNAFTADKLTTARNIDLTGTVTGTVSFDGSGNVSMATSVGSSLQTSLDLKAPLASPTFTGVPTAPTAAALTNTTQVASTAFVDAARVVLVAVDALKAPLASPALTGVPTAPTAPIGTNTTQLATMAALQARVLGTVSQSAGVPTGTILERGSNANGEYVKYADGTLICTFNVASVSVAVTTAYGSLFYGLTTTWTFPIAFVGTLPVVTLSPYSTGKLAWGTRGATPSLTSAGMAIVDVTSATATYQLSYSAIGRWF